MVLHPRHRSDCFDFFRAPDQTELMEFQGPDDVIEALEQAAARTRRTWNSHLIYILELCRGAHPPAPDFDDARSVEDWRALLGTCAFRFSEDEAWSPCTCLWMRTP